MQHPNEVLSAAVGELVDAGRRLAKFERRGSWESHWICASDRCSKKKLQEAPTGRAKAVVGRREHPGTRRRR